MPHDIYHPDLLGDQEGLLQRVINARRAHHYRSVFLDEDGAPSASGQKMLADLDRFCRGNKSTFSPDPRVHALLEGRREVLLRILNFIGIPSDEIRQFVEVQDE